jgi:hypothetical protein
MMHGTMNVKIFLLLRRGKGKGKVHPVRGQEDPEVEV